MWQNVGNGTVQNPTGEFVYTASPVTGMYPNRVFSVGAGFIDLLAALRNSSIVTVQHEIPTRSTYNRIMATMASLSFQTCHAYSLHCIPV